MKKAVVTIITTAVLVAGTTIGALASEKDNDGKRLMMDGTLALSVIVKDLEDKGYTRFSDIEFEKGRYEMEGRHSDGKRFKIYVDAHTGKIRSK